MKVTNIYNGKIGKVINADQVTINEREGQPEERIEERAEETAEERAEEENKTLSLVTTSVEWRVLQERGWMDAAGQPTVTRSEAAVMASEVAQRLGIENKWQVFEQLWGRTNMSRDMQRAMGQRKTLDFMDELKKCLASPNPSEGGE